MSDVRNSREIWRDPRVIGVNPREPGGNARIADVNPREPVGNARVVDANPRLPKRNPRIAGANPRVPAANSRVSANREGQAPCPSWFHRVLMEWMLMYCMLGVWDREPVPTIDSRGYRDRM